MQPTPHMLIFIQHPTGAHTCQVCLGQGECVAFNSKTQTDLHVLAMYTHAHGHVQCIGRDIFRVFPEICLLNVLLIVTTDPS